MQTRPVWLLTNSSLCYSINRWIVFVWSRKITDLSLLRPNKIFGLCWSLNVPSFLTYQTSLLFLTLCFSGDLTLPPLHIRLPLLEPSLLRLLADRRKFTPLARLLPKNRGPDQQANKPTFNVGDNEQICANSSGLPRRRLDNFNGWLESFMIFARFRTFLYPTFRCHCLPIKTSFAV